MNIKDLPDKYRKQVEDKLAPKSKYRNVKETVGNLKFDSKKERQRFDELMVLLKAGQIRDLKLQHEFTLQGAFTDTDGNRTRAIKYIADFTYWQGNLFVIEDVKGMKTDVYRMKKKMMSEKGLTITEI